MSYTMGAAAKDEETGAVEELRLRPPIVTHGLTATITLEHSMNGRIYLRGHTYAVRDVLDAAGAIWCPRARAWFTRDATLANDLRWALVPRKAAKGGKPRTRLKVAVTELDHLRARFKGKDIRCELCAAYVPAGAEDGSCPKGQAFRFGLCFDFAPVEN